MIHKRISPTGIQQPEINSSGYKPVDKQLWAAGSVFSTV